MYKPKEVGLISKIPGGKTYKNRNFQKEDFKGGIIMYNQPKKVKKSTNRITAVFIILALLVTMLAPVSQVNASYNAGNNCIIDYIVRSDSGNSATIDITITNNGAAPLNDWILTWTFPGNQTISGQWSAAVTQTGNAVSAKCLDYNRVISANGDKVNFGININYSGSNLNPSDFRISGQGTGSTVPEYTFVLPGSFNCGLVYKTRTESGNTATIDLTITNKGSTSINGWTIAWTFPGDQKITDVWCTDYTQNGSIITMKNLDYNAVIPANGGNVTLGFNISYVKDNPDPTDFTFNGTNCLNTSAGFQYKGLDFSIPAGCALAGSSITVSQLSQTQMKPIPDDAPNVTSSVYSSTTAGYDINLKDNVYREFTKDIKVTMKYDAGKLPPGATEGSIFIYYYDETQDKWISLNRDSIDTVNKTVTCTTRHFCQMYAGAMALSSETPENEGLNTLPQNINSADPIPGLQNISPPQPNNMGTANLSYPLSVPEGINSLTPSLSINYSNASSDGNCGYGWSIGFSAITRSLKNGVPNYDGTDTLLLDGRELINTSSCEYRLKVEDSTSLITYDEGSKSFKLYKADGSTVYYGEIQDSRVEDPGHPDIVFGWYITKIVDRYDNSINYYYKKSGNNVYIDCIKYGDEECYIIQFDWENKDDARTNGKYGFLVKDDKRISNVQVKYNTTILKQYGLEYMTGAFGKSLLQKINDKNGNGDVLNTNEFQYNTNMKDIFGPNIDYLKPTGRITNFEDLRYCEIKESGGSIFSGPDKTQYYTVKDFTDFNGDGIPDHIYKSNLFTNYVVEYNSGAGFGANKISRPESVWLSGFDTDKQVVRYAEYNHGSHLNRTQNDLVDFNGDGLPDRVAKASGDSNFHVQFNNGRLPEDYIRINKYGFSSTKDIPVDSLTGKDIEDLRYSFSKDDNSHTEVDFVDFNGDGKPDWVYKTREANSVTVQLNSGSSFSKSVTYDVFQPKEVPEACQDLRYVHTDDGGRRSHTENDFVDFNGDGLPDFVAKHRDNPNFYVTLNTGRGFVAADPISVSSTPLCNFGNPDIRYTYSTDDMSHTEIDFVDVNGDGLPDRVAKHREVDRNKFFIQFNTGTSFLPPAGYDVLPLPVDPVRQDLRYQCTNDGATHTEVDFVDFNGDGLPDRVAKHRDDYAFHVQLNLMGEKNRLEKVITSSGTQIDLDYAQFTLDSNCNVTCNFMHRTALSSISMGVPGLLTTKMSISYEDGVYDRLEREFRGFKKVQVTTVDRERPWYSNVTTTTYHVGDKTGEYDMYGINPEYDQYIKGQVDTITKEFVENTKRRILSREKYEYGKIDISEQVKMVYMSKKRTWVYNNSYDNSSFMGLDETNGDISEENIPEFDLDLGMIKKMTTRKYHDPRNNKDDEMIVTEYKNVKSGTMPFDMDWVCVPETIGTYELTTNNKVSSKSYEYDSNYSVFKETKWNNNGPDAVTVFTYDNDGLVSNIKGPDGLNIQITTAFHPQSTSISKLVNTRKVETGESETKKYDLYGRLSRTINNTLKLTVFSYDDYGRPTRVDETINGQSVTTKTFDYRTLNTSTGKVHMAVSKSLNKINTNNNEYIWVESFKDALGRVIQVKTQSVVDDVKCWVVSGKKEYDKEGRIIKTGSSFTVPFSENDDLISDGIREPVTTYYYDKFGRMIQTLSSNGIISENDRELILDSSLGYTRILSKETSRLSKWNGSYDYNRNRVYGTVLQEKESYRDMLEQEVLSKLKKKDGNTISSSFTYDFQGNSTSLTGTTGKIEKKADSLGRIEWMRTPDAGLCKYEYNDKGLLKTVKEEGKNETDGVRHVTTYMFDPVTNQLKTVAMSGTAENITYNYYSSSDPNYYAEGKVESVIKGGFKAKYNYGQLWSEIIKTIDGKDYKTRYEYDLQGRISKLTYPDGEEVIYSYNEGGLLKSITGIQVYIENIKYDLFGQRTYVKYGNGTEMTYRYDDNNRALDILTVKDRNGQELMSYDYNFDDIGNVNYIGDRPCGITKSEQFYVTDSFSGRLEGYTGKYYVNGTDLSTNAFQYDDENRIKQKNQGNTSYVYTYLPGLHALDKITTATLGVPGDTLQFAYDDFGNMKEKEYIGKSSTNTQNYIYDSSNNLKTITGDKLKLEMTYDNMGRRYKKTYGDGVSVIKETVFVNGFYTVSGSITDKHISDGKGIIATKVGNTADGIKFYHSNHIGSTALLTDKNSSKSQSYLYYPYGETWINESPQTGGNDITRLFTGQEFDRESGLYYYNARYFDPALCVFTSPDPALDDTNPYAYCRNNPVMFTDPTGMVSAGLGIVLNWDNNHGWGIGFGAALDASSSGKFGFNASYIRYLGDDGSETYTFGAGGKINFGIVGLEGSLGVSHNTSDGTTIGFKAGVQYGYVGVRINGSVSWSSGGDFRGGVVGIKGYIGNSDCNIGGGYQAGFGGAKSGFFNEAEFAGFTFRDGQLSSFSVKEGIQYDTNEKCHFQYWGDCLGSEAMVLATIAGYFSYAFRSDLERVTESETGIDVETGGNFGSKTAYSMGYIRVYSKNYGPNTQYISGYTKQKIILGKHELRHTMLLKQYGVWYMLSYIAQGSCSKDNSWERECDDYARVEKWGS